MAFLPFKRQFFCFQAVRYAASKYTEMTKADKIQACYQHPVCSMRMAWS